VSSLVVILLFEVVSRVSPGNLGFTGLAGPFWLRPLFVIVNRFF